MHVSDAGSVPATGSASDQIERAGLNDENGIRIHRPPCGSKLLPPGRIPATDPGAAKLSPLRAESGPHHRLRPTAADPPGNTASIAPPARTVDAPIEGSTK